jgi:hypothetical protein
MVKKLCLWSLINVGFGAVPLLLMMICRGISHHPRNSVVEYIPELTFFSVMSGVGVMEDVKQVPKGHRDKETFDIVFVSIIIATLVGAAFLGIYFCATIMVDRPPHDELQMMFLWSRAVAVIYVVLCIMAEGEYLKRVST